MNTLIHVPLSTHGRFLGEVGKSQLLSHISESSRQGVGAGLASSNFAVSHYLT